MIEPPAQGTRVMTCIQCPQGCSLSVSPYPAGVMVEGNRCERGRSYAERELTNPVRTLTSTVATDFPDFPRLSVRTGGDIPLVDVFRAMTAVNGIRLRERLKPGDVVVENLAGTGVPLVATDDMTEHWGMK